MWKKTKEIARSAEYMFKNKDEVQKRVLEATRDDDDQITENEYMTVAHLTADSAALSSIRKTLWKRFSRITKSPTSCRKALQILDYCVRYGSEKCLQVSLEGSGELQNVANSHHFSSDKPREYMNEDQCRNLVQNLLAFIKNRNAYDQARQSGQSTIQRVQSFYVEPLQVKIKADNQAYYSGNSNSYATNTNTSASSNNNQSMNDYAQQKASYSLTPQQNQQKESSNTTTANNGIQWSSDSDSELETDPRQMNRNMSSQQQQQGSSYQSQQSGFSMFNQQKQSSTSYQSSQNPFQTQPQNTSQNNPFQSKPQSSSQNSNPFQNQSNPFNSQQQQYSNYNQQQQQNFFTQPAQQPQQSNFFQSQQQQQSNLSQQERSFFTQASYQSNYQQPPPQQPPSADELLFGPSPTQQQQQQQYIPPQPDPAYNGIIDFSTTPMQQYQPNNQQNGRNGGMLDEFGDLVDLNLNKQPTRAHGRPEMQRGYNNSSQYQQRPY